MFDIASQILVILGYFNWCLCVTINIASSFVSSSSELCRVLRSNFTYAYVGGLYESFGYLIFFFCTFVIACV